MGRREGRNDGAGGIEAGIATVAGLAIVAATAGFVWRGAGNLAWDDADYLRRGLQIARIAASGGWWSPIRFADAVLADRPKPPWLDAWIAGWASILPRGSIRTLIALSSVAPFGLLLIASAIIARRRSGAGAAPVAILAVASSPLAVTFGAKVMVETFLGLWIVLAIHASSLILDRPSRARGLYLGATIGLATLTKLTVALLLPLPALIVVASMLRRWGVWVTLRSAVRVAIPILILAGPWYAKNGRQALEFARFSSRYNVEAEGRSDRVAAVDRLRSMAGEVVGWPTLAASGLAAGLAAVGARRGSIRDGFGLIALSGLAGGAAFLLIPAYFDPRFLLPIWPAVAVTVGGWIAGPEGEAGGRRSIGGRVVAAAAAAILGCSSAVNLAATRSGPASVTYWAAGELIDALRRDHGAWSIANVGNTPDWNVCKTGLINELRRDPASCFVLHDLSAEDESGFRRRVGAMDAVVVLDPAALPASLLVAAPGLNRIADEAGRRLGADRRFVRVDCPVRAGLPPLTVFVRDRRVDRAWPAPARPGPPASVGP